MNPVGNLAKRSRVLMIVTAFAITGLIGWVDYLTSLEYSIDVFYLLPILLAAWFAGPRYGLVFAVLCAATTLVANSLPGAPAQLLHALPKTQTHDFPIAVWKLVLFLFFAVFVQVVSRLRELQEKLELRVQERTAALRAEVVERQRLEEEILNIGERERQRIGHDLHDSLCQHLTATALAGKVLADQLADQPTPALAARRLVTFVEEGITLARSLAHGLSPVKLEAAGLMEALEELAQTISDQFRVTCVFECEVPVVISETVKATHLYRIAQEAISNAIKHGQAKHIVVQLAKTTGGTILGITDDGVGLPDPVPTGRGMGLRIMGCRATMCGGTFAVRRGINGGTHVTCTMP